MYELIRASEKCYYIDSPTKIGIVKLSEDEVCIIDSGNDKDAGKRVLRVLEANGWRLKAIYNTHSHADHIGGNKFLQDRTGCKIYARGLECDATRYPIIEPSLLYGAFPPNELKHKFWLAQASDAEYLDGDKLPEGVELVELPGHYFDTVGFRTSDGAVYIGDALASRATLDKYGIVFMYDVAAYLDTLQKLKTMNAKIFIPAHAEATEDISELAQYNTDKTLELGERILSFCTEPICFDDLLKRIFDVYAIRMTFEQHTLIGSTVRSYLAYFKNSGRVVVEISENKIYWIAK